MNRKKIVDAFEKYVSAYDLADAKIDLKYIHTQNVAENSEQIAKSLHLNDKDIDLCWEIGMLHDIGRFEQLRRYNTFIDSDSIDHAIFGADLLFEEHLIRAFDENDENNHLIDTAIRLHNVYELPDVLTERELLFCQIIRDADKIDIYRANLMTPMEDIYNTTTSVLKNAAITPAVYQALEEHHTVLRSLKQTVVDNLIGHLSLYYGLVFPESKRMVVEQGYLWKLANFHSDNPKTERILNEIRSTHRNEWT